MKYIPENLEESRQKFDIVYGYVVRLGIKSARSINDINSNIGLYIGCPHWYL